MCVSGVVCLSKVLVVIRCFAWDNIIVVQFVQVTTMLGSMERVQQDLQEAVFKQRKHNLKVLLSRASKAQRESNEGCLACAFFHDLFVVLCILAHCKRTLCFGGLKESTLFQLIHAHALMVPIFLCLLMPMHSWFHIHTHKPIHAHTHTHHHTQHTHKHYHTHMQAHMHNMQRQLHHIDRTICT